MKKLFSALVLINILSYGTFAQQTTMKTKSIEDKNTGISFKFPDDWRFKTDSSASHAVAYTFTAPGYAEGQVGRQLMVIVEKTKHVIAQDEIKPLPVDSSRMAGHLIINNKQYPRYDYGSGLHVFMLMIKQKVKGKELLLRFSYNSSNPDSADTKAIEAIIQSFKF
jgi:hypothetical protein